jgi:signal transduction histidine kinase
VTVRDFGTGFDRQDAVKARGLGLISMKERLHLVGGDLSIESQPLLGTAIHARVALRPRSIGTFTGHTGHDFVDSGTIKKHDKQG